MDLLLGWAATELAKLSADLDVDTARDQAKYMFDMSEDDFRSYVAEVAGEASATRVKAFQDKFVQKKRDLLNPPKPKAEKQQKQSTNKTAAPASVATGSASSSTPPSSSNAAASSSSSSPAKPAGLGSAASAATGTSTGTGATFAGH